MAIAACAPVDVQVDLAQLAFLGVAIVPTGFQFQATTIGGLSGISYDPDRQIYYVISDDKSDTRFYSMRIPLSDTAVGAEFLGTYALQNVSGRVDPEDITFDRQRQRLTGPARATNRGFASRDSTAATAVSSRCRRRWTRDRTPGWKD